MIKLYDLLPLSGSLYLNKRHHWDCPITLSKREAFICSKLKHSGKLFVFLRKQRHIIFNEALCEQLAAMYIDHPKGKPPVPSAQLAMATLLQAYEQKSDAGAAQDAMFDSRWRMVLNCLNDESPPFSQGTLCDFRHRLVKHNMDETLLTHTVNVAKQMGGFSHQSLRIALDSAPLQGCGRVEDTFNLVAHAVELVVDCAAQVTMHTSKEVMSQAGTQFVGQSSVKAALDIDWSDEHEKRHAMTRLLSDVEALKQWLVRQGPQVTEHSELKKSLHLLECVLEQDIEPDPNGGSRIKQEIAKDRLISLRDKDMKHGRKSSSRTINGYKQHIAIDMDNHLIIATSVRPANEPEHQACHQLQPKVEKYGVVEEMSIDRGYIAADWTHELFTQGSQIKAKPWTPPPNGRYSKKDFVIDITNNQVTCPEGFTVPILHAGKRRAKFKVHHCNSCSQKSRCTTTNKGRIVTLHKHEELVQTLYYYTDTKLGRAQARERVKVEHALASICNRKGPRARYRGVRLNEYDLNRTAMITNLHASMRLAA